MEIQKIMQHNIDAILAQVEALSETVKYHPEMNTQEQDDILIALAHCFNALRKISRRLAFQKGQVIPFPVTFVDDNGGPDHADHDYQLTA